MDLKEKIVLVTGAASGIGKASALAFAKQGAKVIVNTRMNTGGAREVVTEIEKGGGDAVFIHADVSQEQQVQKLFSEAEKVFGRVDVLINNAGYVDLVEFDYATEKDWAEIFNVNVLGTMLCSKHVLPLMKEGVILNIASIYGLNETGNEDYLAYSAAKAAVINFTKTFAKRVAPKIRVNAVAPGYVQTPAWDGTETDRVKAVLDATYLKRWIQAEEIAEALIYLASAEAVTGEVLVVDAGRTLNKSA